MNPRLEFGLEPLRAPQPVIELTVECEREFVLNSPFSVPQLVGYFSALGSHGGFSGPSRPPEASSMAVRSTNIVNNTGRWLITAPECHHGTVTVLRNLVMFSHKHVAPIARARIRSSLSNDVQWPAIPANTYWPLPFAVRVVIDSDELAVCAEFIGPPAYETVHEVNALYTAWLYVAAAAGLSPDAEETTRPLLIADEEPEWVAHEGWLRLSDVEVDETAYDALINAFRSVHHRVQPLRSVNVE